MTFPHKKPRFLVVRTDKIGDTVLSTPVFELIKKVFPDSFLGVIVRPYTVPLIQGNPFVDQVIVYDCDEKQGKLRNFFRLVSTIRKANFDIGMSLFSTPKSALLLRLARIPHCAGPASKVEQILYQQRIRQKRSKGNKHEAEYNIDIACSVISSVFGAATEEKARKIGKDIKPYIHVSKDETEQTNRLLSSMGIGANEKILIVHPGSGGSSRNWSPERYGAICDAIKLNTKNNVIVTWGRGEKEVIKRLDGSTKTKHMDYGGDGKSLRELISLLKRADVIFTSSTGPLHIAAAVGTRTVSLYCPIRVCLPRRWGPRGEEGQNRVMLPDVPICERCTHSKCPYFDCMESIKDEDVINAIGELI